MADMIPGGGAACTSISVAPGLFPYTPPGCTREELARDILLKLLDLCSRWSIAKHEDELAEGAVRQADALLAALAKKGGA